jgi:cysteine desulfurase
LELKEQSIKMADRMAKVMDQLVSKLRQSAPEGLSFNFRDLSRKLPNTLSMRINGIAARDLVVAFDMHGIGISAGAACASGKTDISHVLLAYGFNDKEARETVRVSLTGNESVADIDRFVSALVTIINRIRRVRE